ncbi:MAG: monovalent cation/H+ antiporter subunit D [Rhodobacteraceae bacterium]|nr:monovalent cation/H+ antiporter subunit D [Paracoccaceae bacterium]
MFDIFPTAFIFFAGALIVAIAPGHRLRSAIALLIPVMAAWQVYNIPEGVFARAEIFGQTLEMMRVDKLSRVFALIFCIAAFLGNLYAWHVRDRVQQLAALFYSGSALGAVFAGDLITLFFYWEGTAIASVFLIWARGTIGAYNTGLRYLIIQIMSGVILLSGAALLWRETGSIAFDKMTLGSLGTWLIFISFGAVYALARGFAGTEILIYIGAIMTLFPIFFAEIENDLRRVLAYSLNNQLGFMVVGVGIGTEMALNGTASHAFAHILYKALLFMSVGAVLFRTGTSKASELGGLCRTMPKTAIFCLIGAASISAFPLFSGFVTKSLIVDATAENHYTLIWAVLVFASAGVLSHSGIKIPYFTFFGHDSGLRPKEAPLHMLLAMGITAFLCIYIGVNPDPLYALLPYEVEYHPYTMNHVVAQLQLLCFALLAFVILMKTGLHPPEVRSINLDTDWIYRRILPDIVMSFGRGLGAVWTSAGQSAGMFFGDLYKWLEKVLGPETGVSGVRPVGTMTLWVSVLLSISLVIVYL